MASPAKTESREQAIRKVTQQELRATLRLLMVTGGDFATSFIKAADVRAEYLRRLGAYARMVAAFASAATTTKQLADLAAQASQMRNTILGQVRVLDRPAGQAAAILLKPEGKEMRVLIARKMDRLKLSGPFERLPDPQQGLIYRKIIESATQDNRYVTAALRALAGASYALVLATLLVSAYDIGTSRRPWWQAGEYAATIAGGVAGQAAGAAVGGLVGESIAAAAAAGAAQGATRASAFGPLGFFIGGLVGGVLGSLIGGRMFIGIVGLDDEATEQLLLHFSVPFVTYPELDVAGLARALVLMSEQSPALVIKVLLTLAAHYTIDADRVALAYAVEARDRLKLSAGSISPTIRHTLVEMLRSGWTTDAEDHAIGYLEGLDRPTLVRGAQ